MNTSLDVGSREPELRALLTRYGPAGATLEVVDSVQDWASHHGLTELNPFRQATSFPGRRHIVMLSVLTEDLARSSGSILRIGPFAHEELARDLWKYARFLLLHEVAHLQGILPEKEADEWALERLNEYLVESGESLVEREGEL